MFSLLETKSLALGQMYLLGSPISVWLITKGASNCKRQGHFGFQYERTEVSPLTLKLILPVQKGPVFKALWLEKGVY